MPATDAGGEPQPEDIEDEIEEAGEEKAEPPPAAPATVIERRKKHMQENWSKAKNMKMKEDEME